jgi:hypothetical protein
LTESNFSWRSLVHAAVPPRDPNDDEDEEDEENGGDEDDDREPAVIREPMARDSPSRTSASTQLITPREPT